MDLEIDAEKIRSLRSKKAWSQEHLAHVAGIGRRTIQRVENTGAASFETAQAIASALDLDVADLIASTNVQAKIIESKNALLRKIYVALTAIGVMLLFTLGKSVAADKVKLDIAAIVDEEHETKASVTNEEGEGAQLQLAGNYRITITPSIADGGDIQLDIILMKQDGDGYVKVGGPSIRTPDGEPAHIRSASDDGHSLSLEITANVL